MTDEPTLNLDTPTDEWAWWRAAEADPSKIGSDALQVHADDPQLGYYRVRRKGGNWEPVAIFREHDEEGFPVPGAPVQAERSGHVVPADKIGDLWLWCCRQPVSYEEWDQATSGGGWGDEPKAARGVGDNITQADPHDGLWIEYLGDKDEAEDILKAPITDRAAADKAAIWADRLIKLSGRADALHKIEKEPVLAEYRRVDDRWRDLQTLPKALGTKLKQHQREFLLAEDRKERQRVAAAEAEARRLRDEANRKIAEAEAEKRRVEDEARRKAEEARQLSREGDYKASQEAQRAALAMTAKADELMLDAGRAVADMKDAEKQTAYHNVSAGRTHARTKLVTRTSAAVDDFDLLYGAVKDRPEVKALLQSIADKAARAGVALAGCVIVQEKVPA